MTQATRIEAVKRYNRTAKHLHKIVARLPGLTPGERDAVLLLLPVGIAGIPDAFYDGALQREEQRRRR